MWHVRRFPMSWLLAGIFGFSLGHTLHAEDRLLTVRLASGREFTAHVDARTDEKLWLRFSSGRGQLFRPIAWDRVVSAQLDGKPVEIRVACYCTREVRRSRQEILPPVVSPAKATPP
jgi:hypothetical protein